MILVKPEAKKLFMPQTFDQCLKHIEYCGRIAYKSTERITDQSAEIFVRGLLQRGHLSVLRHVALKIYGGMFLQTPHPYIWYENGVWVGNLQAWYEVSCFNDSVGYDLHLAFPTIFEESETYLGYTETHFSIYDEWQTVWVVTDRGISHELVRNTLSVTQESSRYCNYKGGCCFVIPGHLQNEICTGDWDNSGISRQGLSLKAQLFLDNCWSSEQFYLAALREYNKPQDARGMLNHHTKTELVLSGSTTYKGHWPHFQSVRFNETTGKVHPQMKELTELIAKEMLWN